MEERRYNEEAAFNAATEKTKQSLGSAGLELITTALVRGLWVILWHQSAYRQAIQRRVSDLRDPRALAEN